MGSRYTGSTDEVLALDVFIRLFRAADTIGSLMQRRLRKEGLTGPQFGVLETLHHLGPLEQHVLAEKLLVSRGNITFILDNLEKTGFIIRLSKPGDRRCNQIGLTPRGGEFIARIFPEYATFIAGLIGALDPEEQQILSRLLKKLGTENKSTTKGKQ